MWTFFLDVAVIYQSIPMSLQLHHHVPIECQGCDIEILILPQIWLEIL